ncbi:MAG: MarR family transcriptional regulator, partial [Deltaproteobacteria bacterium]|nr:MarR family transcriptional regulator [Deltaproteobacteria bacterium]
MRNYRVTIPQLLCLNEIYEHGPITTGALTRLVYLNSSTLTGIVDRLEKQNLVRRTRIRKDRRQIHVEMTEEGLEFIKNAPNPIQKGFLERLQSLEEDKVALL